MLCYRLEVAPQASHSNLVRLHRNEEARSLVGAHLDLFVETCIRKFQAQSFATVIT